MAHRLAIVAHQLAPLPQRLERSPARTPTYTRLFSFSPANLMIVAAVFGSSTRSIMKTSGSWLATQEASLASSAGVAVGGRSFA